MFTVLLSYRAIRVFLVQKFSCPVTTHGHEPICIYTRVCVYMIIWKMQRNLFIDLLAHERNGYRRILSADIKYYLSRITKKSIQQSL